MMERFTGYVATLVKTLKERVPVGSQIGRKRWIAYGGLLVVSTVLFLVLGGSRKVPDASPSGGGTVESGDVFREYSQRLAGLGESRPPRVSEVGFSEEITPVFKTWGRDPFAIERKVIGELPFDGSAEFHFSGISWKRGEAVVLIDDFILREGESIHGAEILNILPGCVVLNRNGRKIILCLRGEDG
jgi:hypothetical protein